MDGYVWQQAGGRRHGRDSDNDRSLPAGQVFHTLCGRELEVEPRDDHTREGVVWLDPLCSACDYRMRRALNAQPSSPTYRQKLNLSVGAA